MNQPGLPPRASRFGVLFPPDHATACRDDLSRRARLDLYTTAASVDDLDDLRRWLGYPSWNLLGTSYGTRVAQVYLRRHLEAVRTAVLNGVAPVARPVYVEHAAYVQRALDADLPASHWEPVRSRVPTLLLSGDRDPVTPPELAEEVAEGLPNRLHVVVPNGGHGVRGPCIDSLVARLVETGRVDGLDPSCVEAAPPTAFRLP